MAFVDDPGLMDVLNQFWDWKTNQMWTAFPGKCIKYDSTIRQASVEVMVKYLFGEDKVPKSIPNLLDVPVVQPGNQFGSINLPKLGDGCFGLMVVASNDISDWLIGSGQAVLPAESRQFDINDGFFIPGVFPLGAPYLGIIDDDVLDISVRVGTKMKIGNGTAELIDLFDQLLTKLQVSVDTPGASSTGTNSLINADLLIIQQTLAQIKA